MEKPATSSAGKRILIVEDDRSVRELLEIIVRKEGFIVETAEDGAEGLQKARAGHPDLILMDLMLPKSGGLEIAKELQEEETGHIPIIIMTGRFMDRSTSELIKQECNIREYLQKPVKTALLAALLHKLLNTRRPA